MGLSIEQKADSNEFGTEEDSFMVPMGYFAVVKNDDSKIKYLKHYRLKGR